MVQVSSAAQDGTGGGSVGGGADTIGRPQAGSGWCSVDEPQVEAHGMGGSVDDAPWPKK